MGSLPLVIVNPASAGGATGESWPSVASALRAHFGPFKCAFTEAQGDATRIAEREARAGRRFIIACGGDGTISEVANGILRAGAEAELGLLPSGTGGDFRRTLKVSEVAADAARQLREGESRRIDVGRVTFRNMEGTLDERFFLNVASSGMGGEVVRRVKGEGASWLPPAASRLLGGRVSFAAAALQTTLTFSKPTLRIRIDERPAFRLRIANLCIANAQYFGGGMRVAPTAKLNDGLLDVVAIGDLSPLSILANSYRIYLGTHLGMREVGHTRARRIEASADADGADVLLEVDGELTGHLPATFEVVPQALLLRTPA